MEADVVSASISYCINLCWHILWLASPSGRSACILNKLVYLLQVPAVASIHEETSGSVKFKNPQVSPSNFGGTTPTIAKPSALRMPSPSAGFFTQVARYFLTYQVTCDDFTATFVVHSFTAIFSYKRCRFCTKFCFLLTKL
jgi:hypothetical protein